MARSATKSIVLVLVVAACGCRSLGCTSRVLFRVPSPDGRLVAVCQEVPVFDGPEFDVRVERPDGSLVQHVLHGGDGDPCSEIAWSPDGRTLAVLTGHVARLRCVDVARALQSEGNAKASRFWPQRDFSTEHHLQLGKDLRFVDQGTVEFTTCDYNLSKTRQNGERRCTSPEVRHRLAVPRS